MYSDASLPLDDINLLNENVIAYVSSIKDTVIANCDNCAEITIKAPPIKVIAIRRTKDITKAKPFSFFL